MTSPPDPSSPNPNTNSQDTPTPGTAETSTAATAVVEETKEAEKEGIDELLPSFLNPPAEDLPDEVEMSLFDHLEELRMRIFYSVAGSLVGIIGCFFAVKPIVRLLEKPAGDVTFLQLAPGEFFFVSIKVAGYSGLLLSAPWILYQVIQFVLPGLTKKERRLLGPIVLGSAVLFALGLVFSYVALVPAALNFFVSYGADVVAQQWSIEKYFDFELLLMFSTAIAFQIPILQLLLGIFGLVNAKQMLSGWRYVLLGAVVLGAVLTPSTDPMTQSLLGGAVMGLYLGGSGLVAIVTGEFSLGQLMTKG